MRCLQRRYRLDEPVGRGGMATVWRGYDLRLQRTVAVKLLSAPLLGDPAARDRIRREALAAARLDHPGVARVYDYGEQRHLTRTPTPFLVMEFVAGSTLAARLRAAGPLPPDETLRIGQQVAAALAAAHEQGIVHRDVKPGNIMLTESGVKVVDFGIAVGAGDDPAEPDGQLWGTPSYLPPELTAGAEAVPAGDVFALGVVLTECLTGQSPQRSPHEPVSVPDVGGLSASHAHLIGRCLAADPDRRPDAADLAEALTGATLAVRPAPGAVATRVAVPTQTVAGPTRPADGPARRSAVARRRRGLLFAAPAAAAAALAGILPGLLAAEEGSADPPAAEAGCTVQYRAQQAADGRFLARISVTGTGRPGTGQRALTFTLPASQRLLDVRGAAWTHHERRVTLRLDAPAEPGTDATATLHGRVESGGHETPERFSLAGVACEHADTHVRTAVLASASAEPAASTEGTTRVRSGTPERDRPAPDGGGGGSGRSDAQPSDEPSATPSDTPATSTPTTSTPTTSAPPPTPSPSATTSPTASPSATSSPTATARPSTPPPPDPTSPPTTEPAETTAPTPTQTSPTTSVTSTTSAADEDGGTDDTNS
ncbi:protein kinase [Verrucosispora sp. CWR15]|uniref:non-specific serine/threonine protein kinase n=1 Tax=Verrucosispora sioxanthis TaxID=2499994 RepID=A0A6M1LA84_9ACTN|nr:serine/threonine-protein kinase [Verrucosispora sioxanthis]NEE65997.1 protein kinase [Verrucosispora sioxanthis]NGM15107.1 protein kinase [Verrucosispora sioxanthis]